MTDDEEARQADADERIVERIWNQLLERYHQDCDDYLAACFEEEQQMTNETVTPADVRDRIVHLDRKIEELKHTITCCQDQIADLEIERAASVDELDGLEDGRQPMTRDERCGLSGRRVRECRGALSQGTRSEGYGHVS